MRAIPAGQLIKNLPSPVKARWQRLIKEYPDVPRSDLHDIFYAGVDAHSDEMNAGMLAEWVVIEEPSESIVNRLFRW